jgi:hypothetical protein
MNLRLVDSLGRGVVVGGLAVSGLVAGLASQAWADDAAVPMFGPAQVDSRFSPDPTFMRGISGGDIPGATIAGRFDTETGPCVGFFGRKADHKLEIKTFFNYLNLVVEARHDTAMIIKGPGGTWCSDNVFAINPSVAGQWVPGRYEIWVGSELPQQYTPYKLFVTELR